MTNALINALQNSLIVSVQAEQGEPLYASDCIVALAQSALNGGAKALRLAGALHIQAVKERLPNVTVIGLTKPAHPLPNPEEHVYITPTLWSAESVAQAGADIVAMDATLRPRSAGESLEEIVQAMRTRFPNVLLMADIATHADGVAAAALGFDVIGTTLSGYTTETINKNAECGPDFELLARLTEDIDLPIILEGRVWHPNEVSRAFELGAHAVVVGSAITRPQLITQRFVSAIPTLKAL